MSVKGSNVYLGSYKDLESARMAREKFKLELGASPETKEIEE
jgi:hypothetical protein